MSDTTSTTSTTTTPTTPVPPAADAGATPEQLAAAKEAEARLAQLLALGDVNQANAVTGVFGDSGSGKTTLLASAGEYSWSRFHRIARVYSADPGGFGNKMIRLIRLGIVQVYNPTNHIEPFETMENISKGWWPEKILDPFTGFAAPDVKLVPPTRTEWVVYCPQGHVCKRTGDRKILNGFSLQCPECKTVTNTQNWSRVEETLIRAEGVEHVGLYGFDSGSSLSDWAMEDMANRAAANDPGLQDGNALSKTGARIVSGQYAFGANTQQHYGFAQNAVRRWIKNSRLIPGQVVPAIWTFLVQRGSDDNSNMAVLGPKIAGNARTAEVPSWLGNCLHAEVTHNEKGQRKHRLWLVNHMAPGTTVPYLAKTRSEPGDLPDFLEDQEGEAVGSRCSLVYFFDQLELALNRHAQQDAIDFADAPAFKPLEVAQGGQVLSSKDLNTSLVGGASSGGRAQIAARPAAGGAVGKPAGGAPAAPAAPGVARPVAAPAGVVKPSVVPATQATQATQAGAAPASPAPAAPVVSVAPPPAAAAAPAGRPPTPPAAPRRAATPPPAGVPRPPQPGK